MQELLQRAELWSILSVSMNISTTYWFTHLINAWSLTIKRDVLKKSRLFMSSLKHSSGEIMLNLLIDTTHITQILHSQELNNSLLRAAISISNIQTLRSKKIFIHVSSRLWMSMPWIQLKLLYLRASMQIKSKSRLNLWVRFLDIQGHTPAWLQVWSIYQIRNALMSILHFILLRAFSKITSKISKAKL